MFNWIKKKEPKPEWTWVYAGTMTRRYGDTRTPYLIYKCYVRSDDPWIRKVEREYADYCHKNEVGISQPMVLSWSLGEFYPWSYLDNGASPALIECLAKHGITKKSSDEHDWNIDNKSVFFTRFVFQAPQSITKAKKDGIKDKPNEPEQGLPDKNRVEI